MKYVPPDLGETADISRGHSDARTRWKNFLAVVIVLGALYLLLGLFADLVAAYIPEHLEARLVKLGSGTPEESSELLAPFQRAEKSLKLLTDHTSVRPLPYQIFFVELDSPNAFAIPGGGIGVTSALLEKIKTEGGLAMVIAHELGHHHYRHTLRQLGRGLIYNTVIAILFGNSNTSVTQTTLRMAEMGYSRDQEMQADEFGMRALFAAYGHTDGALEFFEFVENEKLGVGSKWQAALTTHPYTPDRIKRLKEIQTELGK